MKYAHRTTVASHLIFIDIEACTEMSKRIKTYISMFPETVQSHQNDHTVTIAGIRFEWQTKKD